MFKDLTISLLVGAVAIGLIFWLAFGSHLLRGESGGFEEVRLAVFVEDAGGLPVTDADVILATKSETLASKKSKGKDAVRLTAHGSRESMILTVKHGDAIEERIGKEIFEHAQNQGGWYVVTVKLPAPAEVEPAAAD